MPPLRNNNISSPRRRHHQVVEDEGDETMAASSANTGGSSRPRLDSRDIPWSYSGLYGQGGSHEDSDLLPFELSLNRNTDWLRGGWLLLLTYVSIILIFQCLFMVLDTRLSWTLTNAGHLLVTLVFLHWIKGSSPNADQGEMDAMTLWEQLQCTSGTDNAQRALLIVPTVICYAACHFSNYDLHLCAINILLWAVTIIAKLPYMNGVRILGINRTAGIDDDFIAGDHRKDD